MINRLEQIQKQELLDSYMLQSRHKTLDFSKIKVGDQFLKDATLNFGNLSEVNPRFTDKTEILKAMYSNDYQKMRDVSNFFFKKSLSAEHSQGVPENNTFFPSLSIILTSEYMFFLLL